MGAKVCLIDKARLGGDCLRYGCVPSKTLIHAAKLVKNAREALTLTCDETEAATQVDMAKVARRIQGVIGRVGENEQCYVKGVAVKFGRAEFKSATEISLNGELLTARKFIIATGAHPRVPPIEGLPQVNYLTNESIFDLMHLPASLLVAGGGPLGVELAQAFARLGSRVTLLQSPTRLLPKEEPEISEAVAGALAREGVEVITGAYLTKVRQEANSKIAEARRGDETLCFETEELLLAVGREPNVAGLNLAAAGVNFSQTGIETDKYLQTSVPNIYAAGDVLGGYLFTHAAAYQAGVAARNALIPLGRKPADYRVMPSVTFTDPEVARVGLTETTARQQYGNVKILRFPWQAIDRAQTQDETEGFIKLVLDEAGEEILGAHLFGANAGEVLGEIALAMQHKLGISAIVATIHAYPTLANGLQSAATEFYLESLGNVVARKAARKR